MNNPLSKSKLGLDKRISLIIISINCLVKLSFLTSSCLIIFSFEKPDTSIAYSNWPLKVTVDLKNFFVLFYSLNIMNLLK